jgi:uncharacterized protein (TIGR03067 family)
MRVHWLGFTAVLLAGLGLAMGGDDKKGKLQGAWTAKQGSKKVDLTFAKGKFTFAMEEKKVSGDYAADRSKKPNQLDMTIKEGAAELEGKIALCIFELDGDTLKWCANKPGSTERPKSFPDKEGEFGDTLYLIFKRAK